VGLGLDCNQKESKMKIKNNQKGVTLLEMMIITVIIGIASTLALPRFDHAMDKLRLKTAGRDVISALRLARSNAISQKFQFGVYIDTNAKRYKLFKDLANPGSYTYQAGADSDVVIGTLPGNVNFGSCSFSNFAVIFKPDGSASTSGSIELHNTEEGYPASLSVDVLSSTGRVKLIAGS
jgi:prepilin-type N-terminal cleavage/methylation domain-containing protein